MFSERLKSLRTQNGLTQKEFAKRLNVSTSTVSMWEIGQREPDNKTLIMLAKELNTSVEYLVTGNTIPPLDKKEEHQTRTKSDVQELYDLLLSIGVKDPNKKLSPKAKERLFKLIKNNTDFIFEYDDNSE